MKMRDDRAAVLKTPRLVFSRFHPDDAPGMHALNSDPEVVRYTGDVPFASLDEARALIEGYDAYERWGFGRWSVFLRPHLDYVGWCGLKYDAALDEVDVGFRFFRSVWNRGIATEAARATIRYGFDVLGLRTIVGRAMVGNAASHRVLSKVGMTPAGEFEADGAVWKRWVVHAPSG